MIGFYLKYLKATQTGDLGGKMTPELGNFMCFWQLSIIPIKSKAMAELGVEIEYEYSNNIRIKQSKYYSIFDLILFE